MSPWVYWLAERECGVPPGDGWLGEREIAVLERLRIPKRRADWRLGRWTAKRAIAIRLGIDPGREQLREIEIRPAASGAPQAFFRGEPAGLAISLSHCDGHGFCGVASAGVELGCDVESVAPHSRAFLLDYFTPGEQRIVARGAPAGQMAVLTLLWSAKESTLKALQLGLRCDPRSVLVVPGDAPPGEQAVWHPLTTRAPGGRVFHGWWQESGGLLWTVIADPPSARPAVLS